MPGERRVTDVKLLRRGLFAEYASLAWMSVECAVAIYSGVAAWSLALLAFGGDSLVELLSSFAVVQHLRTSLTGRPSATGHVEAKRVEWVTTLLLLSLIPVIGLAAVYAFFSGIKPESSLMGIAVAVAAVVIMPVLWFEKKQIGTAVDCLPLTIDAAESATCFWMSTALLCGLAINYVWRISWIDYLATFAILVFVAKEAGESIREVRER
jgi:divalent metal cation (Fe/Co/Zn/Cd) transporter